VYTALAERTGAELVRFESSTHFPTSEEPERFNALLCDVWGVATPR
jgi:pimeloyl-ACP methyl ester carboxylesterase